MRLRLVAVGLLLSLVPAGAQWQVPDHTIPIGRGPGFAGFKNAAPGVSGQVLQSTGASTDPAFTNPTIWTPEEFGASCDAIRVSSASVTVGAGSTALTVTGANFLTTDVGKFITVQSAGTAAAYHTTTIAARVSATQVTLGVAAVTAVAGVAKEVVYGTDNTTAFQTVSTAINAGTVKNIQFRAGSKCLVWPNPSEQELLFNLTGVRGLVFDGTGAEIIVAYTNPARTAYFMQFTSSADNVVRGINGYAVSDGLGPGGSTGLNWFYVTGVNGTGNHRISFEGAITGGRTFVGANRGFTGVFNTDITVKGKILNVFYGATNESAIKGHYITLNTENPGRSLIIYGNPGPTVFNITSKNPLANDIIFTAYGHSTATDWTRLSNVKGTYVNLESTSTWPQIYFSHQQTDPAVDSVQTIIENVDVTLDLRYPAVAGNCLAAASDSYIGHSGTATLGDASGHIERNIRFNGSIRGKCTSTMFNQAIAANGWTAGTGKAYWSYENVNIVDQTNAAFLFGRGAVTSMYNVRAPNSPVPTYEGSPSLYDHNWIAVSFNNAPGGASPFNATTRLVDPHGNNVPQLQFHVGGGATRTGQIYQQGDILNLAALGFGNRFQINLINGDTVLGGSGNAGTLAFGNATSGTVKLQTVAGALGSPVLSLPAATDTLVGKATTDTLTNKTFDSAGTGNTLQVSGVTVSRGQYPSINTNTAATAGNIGERVVSIIESGSAVSISSTTATNLTSISLGAGDWMVGGKISWAPAAGTTSTLQQASISTTSATRDLSVARLSNGWGGPSTADVGLSAVISPTQLLLSGTTTVYLVGFWVGGVSTMQMYGVIEARRR